MTSVLSAASELSELQQRIRRDTSEFVNKYMTFARTHKSDLLAMNEKDRFDYIAKHFCIEDPYVFEEKEKENDNFGLSCSTSEVRDLTRIIAECFPGFKVQWWGPEDCGGDNANIHAERIKEPEQEVKTT